MAKALHRLRAIQAANWRQKGLLADGGGLYLKVTTSGSKSWIYRFTANGRTRDMGLGPYASVSLSEARERAQASRVALHRGLDPIAERERLHATAQVKPERAPTFRECAEAYLSAHEQSWRNPKHRQQWRNTLRTYAHPIIGHLAVDAIDVKLVCRVLEQSVGASFGTTLWASRPETASRLRGRLEAILDWARVREIRSGENPARWRGHLDALLPAPGMLRRVVHHSALPYLCIPELMTALQQRTGVSARGLEFTILTAARTTEVLLAEFSEIDEAEAIWTLPSVRMKAGREHRVPLSDRAISIVAEMKAIRRSKYIFAGEKPGRPLSSMALLMLLRDLYPGRTVHGFRSSFKDWAAEQTNYPNFLSEAALAHVVADRVEAAYRRSDLLQRRRKLMDEWEAFCLSDPSSTGRGA